MDWSDVAKTVAKSAPLLGSALGGPVGGALGALVASIFGVEAAPDKVGAALAADPRSAVKLREVELAHKAQLTRMVLAAETAKLTEINRTMRAETRSDDAYVRRWRPTFGYAVALAWTAQMGAMTWAIIVTPALAGGVISAMGSLSMMWGVALSVLGVAVHQRSKDKAIAAGKADGPGFMAGLLGRIGG